MGFQNPSHGVANLIDRVPEVVDGGAEVTDGVSDPIDDVPEAVDGVAKAIVGVPDPIDGAAFRSAVGTLDERPCRRASAASSSPQPIAETREAAPAE